MSKGQAQAKAPAGHMTVVEAMVGGKRSSVQVTVRESVPLSFGKLLNMAKVDLAVQSTASLAGTTRLCLLALDPTLQGAFRLEASARITATDCSLYSNSTNAGSIQAMNSAVAASLSTCTAGGFQGSSTNFRPPPATGCPPLKDPLADRERPAVGPCKTLPAYLNPTARRSSDDDDDDDDEGGSRTTSTTTNTGFGKNIVGLTATLDPGTYCGGLQITNNSVVTLRPGIYIMKNGPLVVHNGGSLKGEGVGFYFTGDKTGLLLDKQSTVGLTAPKDGVMSGLLFFEDATISKALPLPPPKSGKGLVPELAGVVSGVLGQVRSATQLRQYRIISDNAHTLLGTIYLPAGRLIIDSTRPIADQSAYTVIVARVINLYDGPDLRLNARYGNSDIPVPKGVGPSSADTVLTQ